MTEIRVETYAGERIRVARGVIDAVVIADALQEAKQMHEQAERYGGVRLDKGKGSKHPVRQVDWHAGRLREAGMTAIATLLTTWRPSGYPVATVNHQPAQSFQAFHEDGVVGSPAIVHLNDGGRFDYIPVRPRFLGACNVPGYNDFQSIPVDAGDVLEHFDQTLVHRGYNPSDTERYTIGLYDIGDIG